MVLPAPPAHASPVEPHWFDKLVVAFELSAGGVLTLVDNAAPARLREVYLRLHARDPAIDVIVDVRRLAELPPRTTVILALDPAVDVDDLDWLNVNRPVVSDRRHNVVLWCEGDAAAILARRAPDFFDWISARVDCPPAPAAHAVADLRHALCARASGVAWTGPGLEETLAAVRPGRPVRRVTVASYQSMLDALTSHEPGWLFLEGIDSDFHLRRLRWAMAETGRRVIVFRRSIAPTAPGWWTVHARHMPIAEAVDMLTAAGGTGRLVALTGLDPDACMYARFALRRGIEAARLEAQLAAASDPRAALQHLAQQAGWTAAEVLADQDFARRIIAEQCDFACKARHGRDDDPVVLALRELSLAPERWAALRTRGSASWRSQRRWSLAPERWADLGIAAGNAGDFEVAIGWLTAALWSLPSDVSSLRIANLHMLRGRALHRAGDVASARPDLELAYSIAQGAGDASLMAKSAASLANALLEQGEPLRARACLESALSAREKLDDEADVALLLDMLARVLVTQGDLVGAYLHLKQALAIKRRVFATEDHPSIAISLAAQGRVLAAQGDMEAARSHLERSLEINERLLETNDPSVTATLHALARVQLALGDVGSARALLERALTILEITLGSEHPEVADTRVDLARVTAAQGDLDGAQAALEDALAIQQKVPGNDDGLSGVTTRRALADVLVSKGDLVGARGQLERALAIQRKIFERDDHPEIAATLRDLERLQRVQQDLQRAD